MSFYKDVIIMIGGDMTAKELSLYELNDKDVIKELYKIPNMKSYAGRLECDEKLNSCHCTN